MTTSVIFARNHANIIGVDQQLPWSFEEDMAWFKKHTLNQVVIMGRKTMESFKGKMLPDRENYVVSSTLKVGNEHPGFYVQPDLETAVRFITHPPFIQTETCQEQKDIFIIGGAGLIKEAIPLVDQIIMTSVSVSIDESKHREVTKLDITGLEGYYNEYMTVDGYPFKFVDGKIRSLPNRLNGCTYFVHFSVHERVLR